MPETPHIHNRATEQKLRVPKRIGKSIHKIFKNNSTFEFHICKQLLLIDGETYFSFNGDRNLHVY